MNGICSQVKVALIIPVYNVEKYLSDCLDSILAQTYKNFVAIAVNDGSQDNSLKVLQKYQQIDPRIFVISKSNGGICSARNAGLDAMPSDIKYVSFIDSDDKISIRYLESFVTAMEKENADYGICSFASFDKGGIIEQNLEIPSFAVLSQDDIAAQYWSLHKTAATGAFLQTKMFRAEAIRNLRFDESIRNSEDHEFMTRAILRLTKGVVIPEVNFFYRKRASSISSQANNHDWLIYQIYSALDIERYTPSAKKNILRICDTNRLVALRYFYSSGKFDKEWITKYIAEQRKIPLRSWTLKNFIRHKMLFLGYHFNRFYYSLSTKNKTRKHNPNAFP